MDLNLVRNTSLDKNIFKYHLEPIHTIIRARAIFGESERMPIGFYVGVLLILGTIIGVVKIKRRMPPDSELLPVR